MDADRATADGSSGTDGWLAAAAGLVAGALGFAAVFGVTALQQRDRAAREPDFADALAAAFGSDAGRVLSGIADWLEPDPTQVVAWVTYASHRIPLRVDAEAFGNTARRTVDVQSLSVWSDFLAYLPPVVLFAAGVAVVGLAGVDRLSRAWQPGVAVAAGYVAAALVAFRAASYERSLGVAALAVAPDPVTVALHTAAYAVVFGLGGALAAAIVRSALADG
ncbi:hypothetical protein [Halobacterium jilantaiense]|uniref:DUF7978 domain-containing protein n=1 Tax=Halobacterium jilantaiense TaxID=355548 RepID=A0A1I0MRR7_9EURY|nr:hypothetical protein [Halobacterium jilantaiense]SEV91329.1 hypothetical protein SAMN04487945_0317 [Halobacterium jilantaiense]